MIYILYFIFFFSVFSTDKYLFVFLEGSCSDGMFQCSSGLCIDISRICDDEDDCPDKEDEDQSNCHLNPGKIVWNMDFTS